MIEIRNDTLTAVINPHGAELTHLRDAQGRELMTDADPAFWTGRAPILFPIVGALNNDRYRVDGREYTLPKHGFARRSDWEVLAADPTAAKLRLTDSAATREAYPFAFALELAFAVDGATLTMTATLDNPGDADLPASFGYHPAFAWPLPYGEPREAHRLTFERPEPQPLRALSDDGLILPAERATPVAGDTLMLADDLFTADALIWDTVQSRSLRYGADSSPSLDIAWDAPMLGVWTKPHAHYVCVEPWWGIADPAGFDGDIWDKPGILRLAPGERRQFTMRVTLHT